MVELGVAAFVVVVLELVFAAAVVVIARRYWRQLAPQLRPMLAMFSPAQRISDYTPPADDDDPRGS